MKDETTVQGIVTLRGRARAYKVRLDSGIEVLAYLAGKLDKHKIKVLAGDKVDVVLSEYDLTRGRIVYRH